MRYGAMQGAAENHWSQGCLAVAVELILNKHLASSLAGTRRYYYYYNYYYYYCYLYYITYRRM